MSFQEEIKAIRERQKNTARENQSEALLAEHRVQCGAYIDAICDAVRREIKVRAIEGKVSYDTLEVYRFRDGDEELDTEKKTDPHYYAIWLARYEADFSSSGFFYDPKELCFSLGEIDTMYYLLDEVEKRLEADGIFPVENQENIKESMLFGWRRKEERKIMRRRLRDNEGFRTLQEEAEAYRKGLGDARQSGVIGSGFAYFIKE